MDRPLKFSLIIFILFSISFFFSMMQPLDRELSHLIKDFMEKVIPPPVAQILLTPFVLFFTLVSLIPGTPAWLIGASLWCKPSIGSKDVVFHCNEPLIYTLFFIFSGIFASIPLLISWYRRK